MTSLSSVHLQLQLRKIFFQFPHFVLVVRKHSPIMQEDTLDAVDSLQHLFSPNDSDDLQPPAPSLCLGDQVVKIKFAAPIQQAEESYRTITLSLLVDPSPGCGGIAWPAGEVGSYAPYGCRLPPSLSSFRPLSSLS